ncbi:MAG: sporulation protein [Acidobacteria bacterium]|nr:MAG: sporulation protein [Acidobacteriota bacterium]MCL4286428.1 sporulation protein [Thermoleophilia bacterium]GIK78323.1 MAG: hypothetical protein BroJett022_20130 [Actinomycetes bacterium]
MATPDEIEAEVGRAAETGRFLAALAERIGARARSSAVFGPAVERGDVTVIPVARASWGFGGGAGGEGGGEGSGGGGGGIVSPLGYIEVRESGAEFRPIRDPRLAAAGAATAIAVAALIGRAWSRSRT